jgi:hypothetical protein
MLLRGRRMFRFHEDFCLFVCLFLCECGKYLENVKFNVHCCEYVYVDACLSDILINERGLSRNNSSCTTVNQLHLYSNSI